jgi:hydroxymethylglutaryl-CoA lyase
MTNFIKLIECPRDAMQGWSHFIPTSQKIEYINALLGVGFDTIDFGSFVSPKAIPQMADTKEVLKGLDLTNTKSKLLAIVANERGATEALEYEQIDYLGFPFSISETFQQRNTNSSIATSLQTVSAMHQRCIAAGKQLVVYLSMGFGNPYGDEWSPKLVSDYAHQLADLGISIISLADTVGLASEQVVSEVTASVIEALPNIEVGVHLHAAPSGRREKILAAYRAGCRRFDGALKGIGGCPMADDELVGNMDTEEMITVLEEQGRTLNLDREALHAAGAIATRVFR